MIVQGVSISEMLNQSIKVLTRPSITTFEQYEKRGTRREALIYMAVAAAVGAVVALVFGVLGLFLPNEYGFSDMIGDFLGAFIGPVAGFFVFAYVLHWMGRQQGGTGTQDEVFYTVALYAAPILAINGVFANIPFINLFYLPIWFVLTLYQLYLAYLASRSSLNLRDDTKAIISVVAAILAQWLVMALVFSIL